MQDFVKKLRLLTGILVTLAVMVAVLFTSVVLYHANPSAFTTKKISAENWKPKSIARDLPEGRKGKLIKYGYLLVSETPNWIGPNAKIPKMIYAGNNLACKNCHLESGTKPGSASFVGVANRYPQFRGREGKTGTLEDRINGCMERSMNGKELPEDSREMEAIVAYMEWLSEDVPTAKEAEYKGFAKIKVPDVAADTITGKAIYLAECQVCHGEIGEGIRLAGADSVKGYQYPPLAGNDTYNHGAGMNRVITAAQFIKGNMPFGVNWNNPRLTDEEAFHVAAYIDGFDRPIKENAAADFPDKKLKPVSTPYGPWDDPFPAEQHKYGPFPPIINYYQQTYAITKNN